MLGSLRNKLGHWGLKETLTVVSDRFLCRRVLKDVARYGKTCDTCQWMKSTKWYATSMFVLQSGLLDVFLTDFAGPLPKT